MKRLLLALAILLLPLCVFAQLTIPQGGTGTTTVPAGYILAGNSALHLTAVSTTTASCSGNASCSSFTVIGSSPVTITATGGTGSGLSTSTPLSAGNLLEYSSSGSGSAFGAATSTLTPSAPLTGSFIQIGSSGSLGIQQANGSQGGYLSSTDWTTFNNKQYAFSTSTLTASSPLTGSFIQVGLGGSLGCQTASGSQAGCLASADWTTFNNKQAALTFTWPLVDSANTVSNNATTSPWAANQFMYTNSAGLEVTAASSSLDLPNSALQNQSVTVNTSAPLGGGGSVNLGGTLTLTCATCSTFSYPFPNVVNSTNNNSTSSIVGFTGGIDVYAASSTITNLVMLNSTTTDSTTTIAEATLASTTNLFISSAPSALLLTGASGSVGKYGGASACSSNNFVTTISATGGTTCGTAAISGVNLGSNLNALTNDAATLNGSSYNGSAAVSNWAVNTAHAFTWSALHVFTANASTSELSVQGGPAYFGGTSTSTIQGNGATSTIQGTFVVASTSPNALVVQDQYSRQDLLFSTASSTANNPIVQFLATTSANTLLWQLDQYGMVTVGGTTTTTGAPTIAGGTGAGTGASLSITGNNNSQSIIITTAGTPAGSSATIATITLGGSDSCPTNAIPTLTAENINAAQLSGSGSIWVSTSTTGYAIRASTTGLVTGTLYEWTAHLDCW